MANEEHKTRMRIRNAAMRATRVYPGPVGELLRKELDAYADFPSIWTSGRGSALMLAVVEDVLARSVPVGT